jgi:hypothetical protein
MRAALRSRLMGDATVSSLVGTRVDWGLRPQAKSLPAIRLTVVPTPRDYTMGGAQNTQFYRVQVDCFADRPKTADDLRQAVIACLEPAAEPFAASFVERDFDQQEKSEGTVTGEVHTAILEFKVTHVSA